MEHVSVDDAAAAGFLDEMVCCYCGCALTGMWTLEHKEPLKLGGAHKLDNLAKACPACNEDKHIQTELEYMARLDLRITGGMEL